MKERLVGLIDEIKLKIEIIKDQDADLEEDILSSLIELGDKLDVLQQTLDDLSFSSLVNAEDVLKNIEKATVPSITNPSTSHFKTFAQRLYSLSQILYFENLNDSRTTSWSNRIKALKSNTTKELKSVKADSEEIKSQIVESRKNLDSMKLIYEEHFETNDERKSIHDLMTDINIFHDELFNDGGIRDVLSKCHENINLAYQEICKSDEGESLLDKIVISEKNSRYYESKIKSLYDDYFTEVEVGEVLEASKKEKIDRLADEFQDYLKASRKTYDNFFKEQAEKIKALIGTATVAGLAAAYEERSQSLRVKRRWLESFFAFIIFVLVFGIFISYYNVVLFQNLGSDFVGFIKRLSYATPLIWLGTHLNKQANQVFRLEQYYNHKASVAKSFEGLKIQIKELIPAEYSNDDGQNLDSYKDLEKQLLDQLIQNLGINPAKETEKVRATAYPIHDVGKKMAGGDS